MYIQKNNNNEIPEVSVRNLAVEARPTWGEERGDWTIQRVIVGNTSFIYVRKAILEIF